MGGGGGGAAACVPRPYGGLGGGGGAAISKPVHSGSDAEATTCTAVTSFGKTRLEVFEPGRSMWRQIAIYTIAQQMINEAVPAIAMAMGKPRLPLEAEREVESSAPTGGRGAAEGRGGGGVGGGEGGGGGRCGQSSGTAGG